MMVPPQSGKLSPETILPRSFHFGRGWYLPKVANSWGSGLNSTLTPTRFGRADATFWSTVVQREAHENRKRESHSPLRREAHEKRRPRIALNRTNASFSKRESQRQTRDSAPLRCGPCFVPSVPWQNMWALCPYCDHLHMLLGCHG